MRRLLARLRAAARPGPRPTPSVPTTTVPAPSSPRPSTRDKPAPSDYPGDFDGVPAFDYAPQPDGAPDSGEVVWAFVPFEEDTTRGKDRPVLLVGADGAWLLGLGLTSKDHDRDAEQERRAGRLWFEIGSGDWDSRGRVSEVRINRVIRIDPATVRREGGVLDRAVFERLAAASRAALS